MKHLLSGLFGMGRIPAEMRATLEGEGLELLQEQCWGSITFRNYRSPTRTSGWGRRGYLGSLALSGARLVGYGSYDKLLDVPFAHPAARTLELAAENERRLRISFNAAAFRDDAAGSVTLRYATPHAAAFAQRIRERIAASHG